MRPIILTPLAVLALACEADLDTLEAACRAEHTACVDTVRADCERDACSRSSRLATCDLDYELCTPYPSERDL